MRYRVGCCGVKPLVLVMHGYAVKTTKSVGTNIRTSNMGWFERSFSFLPSTYTSSWLQMKLTI